MTSMWVKKTYALSDVVNKYTYSLDASSGSKPHTLHGMNSAVAVQYSSQFLFISGVRPKSLLNILRSPHHQSHDHERLINIKCLQISSSKIELLYCKIQLTCRTRDC